MTFDLLPVTVKYLLAGVTFTVAAIQLILCMYRFAIGSKTVLKIFDVLLVVALSFFTAYLTAESLGEYSFRVSWYVLFAEIPLVCYSVAGIFSEYRKSKRTLTSISVKETVDNLDSGICFADKNGKIVLINYKMNELAYSVLNAYPQTVEELLSALKKGESVEIVDDKLSIYKFKDERVWRFTTSAVEDKDLSGFTQTVAVDVTAIRIENAEIEKQNKELRETVAELQVLYARLADRVREEESLNLKMRLHDDIGASLIELSRLMKEDSADLEEQLNKLRKAVWHFADTREKTLDEVVKKAESIKVKVKVSGDVPEGKAGFLIAAATETCVSNCVNHAKGGEVYVKIYEENGSCAVEIENDGYPPENEIKEGGGLSSLRAAVEKEEGEMKVVSFPRFVLRIKIPAKGVAK